MTNPTTPQATTRPATFDALLLSCLQGLRNLARRLSHRNADDLLNATVVVLLTRWQAHRPEDGFWMWAQYTMREVAHASHCKAAKRVDTEPLSAAWRASTPAGQIYAAEAQRALAALSGRSRAMTLRRAAGDTYAEIANDNGMSRERVRQIVSKAREIARRVA